MVCHEFKGDIGTASRWMAEENGGWAVGSIAQANYGRRHLLRVAGAPSGVSSPPTASLRPLGILDGEGQRPTGAGSIIVILAADAPLLQHHCEQLYRTPVFGTLLFGVVTIVVHSGYIFSSSVAESFETVVSAVGAFFAIFYAATAIATTVFYRTLLTRSIRDALLIGVFPLASAAILIWILIETLVDFSGATKWTFAVVILAGMAMMTVARFVYQSPFFSLRREAYQPASSSEQYESERDPTKRPRQ